jgi:small GTP-binding protein
VKRRNSQVLQKKISVLGSNAVGKTSLTERFVKSVYSGRYLTTVGVCIHKKVLTTAGRDLSMIIWDLAGEDEFLELRPSHLRGSSGYLLVADGTRLQTLEHAVKIQRKARAAVGDVPFLLAINKADRAAEWEVEPEAENDLAGDGWTILRTSAKDNVGVTEAFETLAGRILTR